MKIHNIGMDTKVWSNPNRIGREYRSFRWSLLPNSFVQGNSNNTSSFSHYSRKNSHMMAKLTKEAYMTSSLS